MANPKKRRKLLIWSGLGLLLASLTLVAIFKKKEPVVTVQTEKVRRRNLVEKVVANGKIQPVTQVVISPEVAGEIVGLPVKEGDHVKKGDLLVQIKPDNYIASRNSAEASYRSATAQKNLAKAQWDKAEAEYKRNQELFANKLISDSVFLDFKTTCDVARLQYENAVDQEDQARYGLDKAIDDLSKTTIVAPIAGTVVRLNSQLGERVLGTSFNNGTEIMTLADLSEMEARVDIGETDVLLIKPGQKATLQVDAFRDRKFTGIVTDIANSAKGLGQPGLNSGSQDATKFEVSIRIHEKELFLPGMTVTAEIETRYRTNVLCVPIASVTTRMPKAQKAPSGLAKTNLLAAAGSADVAGADRKPKEPSKPIEVVFIVNGDHARMVPVKIGISDEDYWEIIEGLREGQEVVSGGYRAIGRDLEDGTKIVQGRVSPESAKQGL